MLDQMNKCQSNYVTSVWIKLKLSRTKITHDVDAEKLMKSGIQDHKNISLLLKLVLLVLHLPIQPRFWDFLCKKVKRWIKKNIQINTYLKVPVQIGDIICQFML